jgi:spore coat polysaccharide biosynthesis protein SpsF
LNIGVIIQARMGSTRLPGKVLRTIGHLPLLGHVLGRLAMSKHKLSVVVATSTLVQDDDIAVFCQISNVKCFRGDESDVLDRYYQCAKLYEFKHVVRLTADNPFTDIEELDRLIDMHMQMGFAFTHSFGQLPVGVGAEIFTFDALKQSWKEGHEPHHREHVDEYLIENPTIFKTGVLEVPTNKNKPALRLTVDTEEDLKKASSLVEQVNKNWLTTEQVIELCLASA